MKEAQFADKELHFLFLISVSSSGRLCGLFNNLVPESTIVVVCRTSRETLPCKHDLAVVEINNQPADQCELCNTHPRIHVDPQTYELIPHLDWKAVVVGLSLAREKAQFWSAVSRQNAVELHKTVVYSGTAPESERHFSVLLDTEKLAKDEWFRGRCREALASLGRPDPPDLILIPQHKHSDVVAGICKEVYGHLEPCLVPAGKLEEGLREPLQKAKHIIIADDVIVTGTTMFNFRSAIYKMTQPAQTRPTVGVFVMVSRTADEIVLESLEKRDPGEG